MEMYFDNINVVKIMDEFTKAGVYVIQAINEENSSGAIFEFEDNSDLELIKGIYEKHSPTPIITPPTEIEKNRADIEYLAIVMGVDL